METALDIKLSIQDPLKLEGPGYLIMIGNRRTNATDLEPLRQ